LILQRFPSSGAKKRERHSVIFTNIAIAAIITVMSLTLGFQNYLLIQLPIIMMAASAGMWMFYVQHQYEDVCWMRHDSWDLTRQDWKGALTINCPKCCNG